MQADMLLKPCVSQQNIKQNKTRRVLSDSVTPANIMTLTAGFCDNLDHYGNCEKQKPPGMYGLCCYSQLLLLTFCLKWKKRALTG